MCSWVLFTDIIGAINNPVYHLSTGLSNDDQVPEIPKIAASCVIYPLNLKRDTSPTNYLHSGDTS